MSTTELVALDKIYVLMRDDVRRHSDDAVDTTPLAWFADLDRAKRAQRSYLEEEEDGDYASVKTYIDTAFQGGVLIVAVDREGNEVRIWIEAIRRGKGDAS
jgi:hypothetical protein